VIIKDGLPQHIFDHCSIPKAVDPCIVHDNKFMMTQESFSYQVRHEANECFGHTIFHSNCVVQWCWLVRVGRNDCHDVVGITEVTADVDAGQFSGERIAPDFQWIVILVVDMLLIYKVISSLE
jgi:hypothetical protein